MAVRQQLAIRRVRVRVVDPYCSGLQRDRFELHAKRNLLFCDVAKVS